MFISECLNVLYVDEIAVYCSSNYKKKTNQKYQQTNKSEIITSFGGSHYSFIPQEITTCILDQLQIIHV